MPNRAGRLLASAACAAVILAAPGPRAAVLEDTVATVNDKPIFLSEFQKELQAAMENFKRVAPAMVADKAGVEQLKKRVLDQMIDNELIEQEGEKRKIKVHDREVDKGVAEVKERNFRRDESGKTLSDEEMDAALAQELKKDGMSMDQFRERIRKQLVIRRVIEEDVNPEVKAPDEKDIRAAFGKIESIVKGSTSAVSGMPPDDAQAYLALGSRIRDLIAERIQLSHILVKTPANASMTQKAQALKKIQALKKRVDAGEDFEDVARKSSEDAQTAPAGGSLGFVVRGWLPPELEKAAFSLPVGQASDPIESPFGYHLLWVHTKKAKETLTYDKAKDDVSRLLYNLRFQASLDKFVKSLRDQAHIETNLPKDKKEG